MPAMDLGHGTQWRLDTCRACPAQTLPAGEDDISDRPGPATRYDPTARYRINATTRRPECAHPSRVHPPAARYPCDNDPASTPAQLQPPDDTADLEAWFIAALRAA